MTPAAIVSTTVGSEEGARRLAHALVGARLAACVQITLVASVYRWEGNVEEAMERMLTCKIAAADFAEVEAMIVSMHDYDVPEIVMVPITAGHGPYLDWIVSSTNR